MSLIPHSMRDALVRWRADRMAFRREAILLEDGRPYGAVMERWQEEDHRAVDEGLNTYRERARGHSKTGDGGTDIVVDLVLGGSGRRIYAAAADLDQARLLHDDIAGKFRRNPLLVSLVKITANEIAVKATRSRLTVLAADVASSWGLRPDGVYVDELAEWPERLRPFWHALFTAQGKRAHCRIHVLSTAGWDKSSIAWEVREMARTEPTWRLLARGQCASWVNHGWLELQRRTLPAHVFARLHEARWVDGVGAFLTAEEVDAVFGDLPQGGGVVAIGLDIGLTRDRTVAAVVRDVDGVVAVEHLVTWQGSTVRKVDLEDVELEVKTLAQRFSATVYLDPYQAVQMAQRLTRQGVQVEEYAFSGDSRRKLFATMLDLVRTRRLRAQPHEELRRELLGLEATETAAGWRVDHKVGRFDDHVVAVALAAQAIAGRGAPVNLDDAFVVPLKTATHFGIAPNPTPRPHAPRRRDESFLEPIDSECSSAADRWDSPFS